MRLIYFLKKAWSMTVFAVAPIYLLLRLPMQVTDGRFIQENAASFPKMKNPFYIKCALLQKD